ncbi:Pyrokinin-1 receptor [Cryptotermes secundus]|uniref:Pyrokinin-1 receptor n=1 Tax=Cryptotermes secundus TaxID=105785 RepID=A0A2J7PNH0_9NEOP|nr:Pyrokinin-1 receptor [Cryptotermes secundus]
MESLNSLPDTSTSPSPSSVMGIAVNEEYSFGEDAVTDFSDLLSTSSLSDNLSHTTTMTMASLNLGPVRDPLYIVIPITILYSVIFFTGIVGNVVTCIVIARNKHMHTATNYYLFSLAVSDLLLLVSGLPQEMYCIWSRYPYVFGEIFCVLRGLAAETSANATVLTITAFTVERYVAICHPFLSHTMSKLSRAVKLILVIWIVALAFAVPQAIQFGIVMGSTPEFVMCTVKTVIFAHSFEISTFLFFVMPMTLITVLYALIGLRLRRSNMMKKDAGSFSCKHFCSSMTTTVLQQPSQRHLESGNSRRSNCCRHHQNQCSRRVLKMLGK